LLLSDFYGPVGRSLAPVATQECKKLYKKRLAGLEDVLAAVYGRKILLNESPHRDEGILSSGIC
jgi:hypothetical protein